MTKEQYEKLFETEGLLRGKEACDFITSFSGIGKVVTGIHKDNMRQDYIYTCLHDEEKIVLVSALTSFGILEVFGVLNPLDEAFCFLQLSQDITDMAGKDDEYGLSLVAKALDRARIAYKCFFRNSDLVAEQKQSVVNKLQRLGHADPEAKLEFNLDILDKIIDALDEMGYYAMLKIKN